VEDTRDSLKVIQYGSGRVGGGFVAVLRSVVRSIKAAAFFAWYGLDLAIRSPKTRRDRAAWLSKFCAAMLGAFGVRFTVEGDFPKSGVLISNHTGYLDILVYAGLSPVVYCAKAEMERWPLLGWMATMAGTVFVDRGAGGSAERAKSGMQAAESEGVPVTFFPEGTTSNGEQVLPFRTGLLAVSMEARQPMTAAFVRYTLEQDNGPGVTVEDDVCFWGDDATMLKHIFKFVGLKGVHAWVKIAPAPIVFSRDDLNRKEAAVEAREAVMRLAPEAVRIASEGLALDEEAMLHLEMSGIRATR
jgi:1-acyl-sn-glycerol-3-phosphate acyltransferase